MIRYPLILLCLFFSLTLAAQDNEEKPDQIEHFTKLIQKEPTNMLLYNNRAEAYLKLNDVTSAMADLNKVIELYKASPAEKGKELVAVAYYKLSETKLNEKQAEPALILIKSAIGFFPAEKTYLLHEARIYAAMPDKRDLAEQKFDNLVSKFGDDEKILMEYAKFLEPTDANKAVVLYEKVLRLNVMNKQALAALGKLFVEKGAKLADKDMASAYRDKAIGFYELLYTIEPERAGIKEALTELYTAQGRTEDLKKLK